MCWVQRAPPESGVTAADGTAMPHLATSVVRPLPAAGRGHTHARIATRMKGKCWQGAVVFGRIGCYNRDTITCLYPCFLLILCRLLHHCELKLNYMIILYNKYIMYV